MNRTISRSIIVTAAFVIAVLAFAQSADKNTAGPTANQLQLRLLEPAEGATITGNQIRVTVGYNQTVFGQGQGTRFGEPNFPHPIFDVFIDNELRQSLKGGEANVATIENVPFGDHKLVVMAKNISGEVIDRKEIGIRTVEAPAVATTTQETTMDTPAAPAAPPPPPPAPAMTAPDTTADTDRDELPATGSSYPRAALMGLALIATGLLFARKAR